MREIQVYVLRIGLGISSIFNLETQNIVPGRVPDTRFVNSFQNVPFRTKLAIENAKGAKLLDKAILYLEKRPLRPKKKKVCLRNSRA